MWNFCWEFRLDQYQSAVTLENTSWKINSDTAIFRSKSQYTYSTCLNVAPMDQLSKHLPDLQFIINFFNYFRIKSVSGKKYEPKSLMVTFFSGIQNFYIAAHNFFAYENSSLWVWFGSWVWTGVWQISCSSITIFFILFVCLKSDAYLRNKWPISICISSRIFELSSWLHCSNPIKRYSIGGRCID